MTTTVLIIVGGIALAALFLVSIREMRAVLSSVASQERPESTPAAPDPYDDQWVRDALADLTLALSEGIEHVDRSERRVRAVIQSAKRRMAAAGYEDPGVDAEDGQIQRIDAERGEREELQLVPENVDGNPEWAGTPWAAVPGIERA
tara:strand:+ start:68 stop:508 length:441 start_codon:yes stop_codon:yes gene_type:complete